MTTFTKLVTIACLLIMSSTSHSYDIPMYFGADGQFCRINYEHNYGTKVLPTKLPGVSPFIGFKLNDIFSIELGYQYIKGVKANTLNSDDLSLGSDIHPSISPISFKSKTTLNGPHINLMLSTDVCYRLPIQFFGGIGLSHTRAVFQRRTMQYDGLIGSRNRIMIASKTLVRTTFGANYFFNRDFALRASVVFLDTRKLHSFASDGCLQHTCCIPEVRPRGSIIYGLGLRWGF